MIFGFLRGRWHGLRVDARAVEPGAGADEWVAQSDDPQFIVTFARPRPRYCVFELAAHGRPLDPVVYVDRGSGFSEEDSTACDFRGAGVYVVDLVAARDVVKLRFDPASSPGSFRLRIFSLPTPGVAEGAIAGRLMALRDAYGVRPAFQLLPARRVVRSVLPRWWSRANVIDGSRFEVSGMHAVGGGVWQVPGRDGRIVLPVRVRRSSYCVLRLEAGGAAGLDPTLLLDRGSGFHRNEAISLPCPGSGLYVLALSTMPEVERIRLDPAKVPARFRFSAWEIDDPRGVDSLVARWFARRGSADAGDPGYKIVEGKPGRPASSIGSRRYSRGVADHYRQVIAMVPPVSGPRNDEGAAPLLSFVVPTYDTPPRFLDDLLASFQAQPPGVAELILADDGSRSAETLEHLARCARVPGVTLVSCALNQGIAATTNAGLARARGTWVGFIDHDDALAPGAVAHLQGAIGDHPHAAFFYTDEVIAGPTLAPQAYHLKPAYDPVLLSGVNYINHLSIYRRSRLLAMGGLRSGFEGSQDYDLVLRYLAGVDPTAVVHVPFPAYLWRRGAGSYSVRYVDRAVQAARLALGRHYGEPGLPIDVEPALRPDLHRVRFDRATRRWPKISVVIPTRDGLPLISRVLQGLLEDTDYPDMEILAIDNGSVDSGVLGLYERTRSRHAQFRAEIVVEPFNFARQINRGLRLMTGEHALLLNNDIEVLEPGWLKEMVACLRYADAGIVGAKLLYPDRTLQHAGVIAGLGGLAGHWFEGKKRDFPGPFGRLSVRQSMSAVTAACMLVSGSCLADVGGLDEEVFKIAYNDVDYCLRASARGYRTIWTPFAELIHHESASRGSDEAPANVARFRREQAALRQRHGTDTFQDPAFSPWYTRDRSEPGLMLMGELPRPRVWTFGAAAGPLQA